MGLARCTCIATSGKEVSTSTSKPPRDGSQHTKLLEDADVFVENMKFGSVERLGLSYSEVSKLNPGIVYGNFSGWGSSGPLRERGSVDPIAQAFAGPAAITGKAGGKAEILRWLGLHDFSTSS